MICRKAGFFAVAAFAAALPVAQASASAVYNVVVTTNFGTQFADCFTFNGSVSSGTLLVGGLPGPLAYTAAPIAGPKVYVTGISTNTLVENYGVSISFSGLKMGTPGAHTFVAIGADANHDSYTVTATQTTACGAQAPVNGSLYKPAS